MKSLCKRLGLVFVCIVISGLLFGCRMSHYERSEIVEWAEENIPVPVTISETYTERTDGDEYIDYVWTAYVTDNPEIKFEIVSDMAWRLEWVDCELRCTFQNACGAYYFEEYLQGHDTDFKVNEIQSENHEYRLHTEISSREQISEIAAQVEQIGEYFDEKGCASVLSFSCWYRNPNPPERTESIVSEVFHYSPGCAQEVRQRMTQSLALYAAEYRLITITEQFAEGEIAKHVVLANRALEITRGDGTTVRYPDLTVDDDYYGISIGAMYEVLTREGFDTNGTPEAYTVTGVDGSVYEFSYWFSGDPPNGEGFEYDTDRGYYFKDGNPVEMASSYDHIRPDLFEQISGMTFSLYSDQTLQEIKGPLLDK